MKVFFLLLYFVIYLASNSLSQTFLGMIGDSLYNGSGENSAYVVCIKKTYDDSLYIGGGFKYAGNLIVNSVAAYDGSNWKNLDDGCPYDDVRCIQKYKSKLYVGGSLWKMPDQPINANLAVWYNNEWHAPEGGAVVGSPVYGFKIFQDKLFMCGNFLYIGTTTYDKIAAFDGENWINVGSFGMWARNLEVFNGELYAGGYWGVKRYLGGTTWENLPIQPNDYVFDLETDTFNTFLYVGGQFTSVNGQYSSGVAMWDGFKWNPMGQFSSTVWQDAMKVYRGELYTGTGYLFDSLVNQYRFYIAKWNGFSWDSIGVNTPNNTQSMEIYNDEILFGGIDINNELPTGGIIRLKMPDNGCEYIKPRINVISDTLYLTSGNAQVQFYSNNPYVNTWQWDFGDGGTAFIKDPYHVYNDTGTYNVQITVTHNGCTKTAQKEIIVVLNSEITETLAESIAFKLYPNPTSGDITVECNLPENTSGEVRTFNSNGAKLNTYTVNPGKNTLQINTNEIPNGVSLCGLYINGKQVVVEKVVKLQ